MKLELAKIRLQLGTFGLSLDCTLDGALVAVFGPSGSGKTTLLELIAGLRRPLSGRVTLDGRVLCDGNHHLPARQRRIGYVPQDLALFPHLSVRANLTYGMPSPADEPSLTFVCEMLEIRSLLIRMPSHLSGGEKQRVAFARAILAKPALLLLDEPLSSLDHPLKERILPYLLRIRDEIGIPMIYVSHSAEEVMRLSDQMIVLERGHSVASGPPADLFNCASEVRYHLRPAR